MVTRSVLMALLIEKIVNRTIYLLINHLLVDPNTRHRSWLKGFDQELGDRNEKVVVLWERNNSS